MASAQAQAQAMSTSKRMRLQLDRSERLASSREAPGSHKRAHRWIQVAERHMPVREAMAVQGMQQRHQAELH